VPLSVGNACSPKLVDRASINDPDRTKLSAARRLEIGTRRANEGPVDGTIRASPQDCRATSRGSRHLAIGPQWIISGANDKLSLTILGKLRCAETAC
jgi:hypothetical protein